MVYATSNRAKSSTKAKKTAKASVVKSKNNKKHPGSNSTNALNKPKKSEILVHKPLPTDTAKRQEPLGHLFLESLLKEKGFQGDVLSDASTLEKYSTDESIFSVTPQLVLQPANSTDVEIAVGVLAEQKTQFTSLSLTPRAAGTGLSGGSLTDSIVLDVTKSLTKIGDVKFKASSQEAFVEVEPGVMWRDMESRLRKVGYYVPTYPSSKEICSVGGAVSNNASGAETLRYGPCADWVESLEVVLSDGKSYKIEPLTYKQFLSLTKKKHLYSTALSQVFALLEEEEKEVKRNKPKASKNTAGYNVWDMLPQGVKKFKAGEGKINPVYLFAGSQGTIGTITKITFRAIPIPKDTTLIFVPIFDLFEASEIIQKAKQYQPQDMEIFDDLTYDLALRNPDFFKNYLQGLQYYRTMLSLYTLYHVRLKRKLPQLMMLITIKNDVNQESAIEIAKKLDGKKNKARVISNPIEAEMLYTIRRSSYSLSKLQDETKRPAAFLEDMVVPTEHLPKFFAEIKNLFREFNVHATVHGHAGDGHFHFYPLLDFTQKTTAKLIEKMSERFFAAALKYGGSLCGEHNDGIIRTPYVEKMFSKKMVSLFELIEQTFDPMDIFNPGKKVNPRFNVREYLRTKNT